MDVMLTKEIIQDQRLNKLNRLKKVNAEAFFYSRRLEELREVSTEKRTYLHILTSHLTIYIK